MVRWRLLPLPFCKLKEAWNDQWNCRVVFLGIMRNQNKYFERTALNVIRFITQHWPICTAVVHYVLKFNCWNTWKCGKISKTSRFTPLFTVSKSLVDLNSEPVGVVDTSPFKLGQLQGFSTPASPKIIGLVTQTSSPCVSWVGSGTKYQRAKHSEC